MTEDTEETKGFVEKKEEDNLARAEEMKEKYEGADRMKGWPYPYTKGANDKLLAGVTPDDPMPERRAAGEEHSFMEDKIEGNLERAEDVKEDYEGKTRMKGWPYPYTKGAHDKLMAGVTPDDPMPKKK